MKNTVITSVTVNGKPTDLHGNPITKDLNVYTEGIFEKSQILNLTGKPRRYFPIQGRIEDGRPDLTARRLAFKLAFGRVATSDAVLLDEDIEKYCKLDNECDELMNKAIINYQLSYRSINKVLKVARTIADLNKNSEITKNDLLKSLNFRRR